MNNINFKDWQFTPSFCCYITWVIFFSFIVRFACAFLYALVEAKGWNNKKEWCNFGGLIWKRLWGMESQSLKDDAEVQDGDRWIPFILGTLELFIYPFLISEGLWIPISGWISLKTVSQWSVWNEKRSVFNRFLIGNVLVVILASQFLAPDVSKISETDNKPGVETPHSIPNSVK